jgi:hypothetical protein
MKDKKGLTKISIIFFSLVFIIIWALFIGQQVAYWGHLTVINGGLTGIEAFLYDNINLLIAIIFFIFIVALGIGSTTEAN